MTIEHTNRQGKAYYLFQGLTKTGKPKYFFSTKKEGFGLDIIPGGFEIYENPNGQVFLRKKELQLITPEEKQMVVSALRKNKCVKNYIVDLKKKTLIIYTAEASELLMSEGLPSINMQQHLHKYLNYSAEMRFNLINKDERVFYAERFCYHGSIDDWITIGNPGKLNELADEFIPCLGNDSFYELGGGF